MSLQLRVKLSVNGVPTDGTAKQCPLAGAYWVSDCGDHYCAISQEDWDQLKASLLKSDMPFSIEDCTSPSTNFD